MLTYIVRRLILMVPTLLGATAIVFFVMALAPGGFGGTVLNQAGNQTEGDEARRIREYFNRRYGLDKSPPEQFGRWLNQISPLGFLTSNKIKFTEQQLAPAIQTLNDAEVIEEINRVKKAGIIVTELAAYFDVDPNQSAQQLIEAVTDLDKGFALIESIDEADQKMVEKVTKYRKTDMTAAKREMLDGIGAQIANRQRILFNRFTFKWPDMGQSLRGRPVTGLLAEAVPITLLLNIITIPIIYVVAILSGIYTAKHRGTLIDVGSGTVMIALWSIPAMWVGVMFIGFLANKQYWQFFPVGGLHDIQSASMSFLPQWTDSVFQRGWLLDMAWHLVLPLTCLTYGGFAVLSKLTRSSILENISADYVRTARAKGVNENDVLYRHVFRNSLLPLITVFAAILPSLFVGSVIVENIFSINGMGKLGVEAAFMKDREVVMGTTLIGSMIGLFFALVRDIWYAIADPRVSYE
jgi:peptide/nickel transport system permease protein